MNNIQQIKVPQSLLNRLYTDHERVKAQISMMADNPRDYTGEVFKHALTVIQWHLGEQEEHLSALTAKLNRLNQLIDQTDEILQAQDNAANIAFRPCQERKIQALDDLLLRGNVCENSN